MKVGIFPRKTKRGGYESVFCFRFFFVALALIWVLVASLSGWKFESPGGSSLKPSEGKVRKLPGSTNVKSMEEARPHGEDSKVNNSAKFHAREVAFDTKDPNVQRVIDVFRKLRLHSKNYRPLIVRTRRYSPIKLDAKGFRYHLIEGGNNETEYLRKWKSETVFPPVNFLSKSLNRGNSAPIRYPNHISKREIKFILVLYIHRRHKYLSLILSSLEATHGIEDWLLIVSHDGTFQEVDSLVKSIRFCAVKQIYAPFSPHLFPDSFPGFTKGDCIGKKSDLGPTPCQGQPDSFGNFRDPHTVSLKHHWWWMMNTVWDGLPETRSHEGHILFLEEDHFVFPNALENFKLLVELKPTVCPHCLTVNLAPSNVKTSGLFDSSLVVERMGNLGYGFNRTVWKLLHSLSKEFCEFDDYNWDTTVWSVIQERLKLPIFTLRGSRASAQHIGKCGLHAHSAKCNEGIRVPMLSPWDRRLTAWTPHSRVYSRKIQTFKPDFNGWGGWGDFRDRELCRYFGQMYGTNSTHL